MNQDNPYASPAQIAQVANGNEEPSLPRASSWWWFVIGFTLPMLLALIGVAVYDRLTRELPIPNRLLLDVVGVVGYTILNFITASILTGLWRLVRRAVFRVSSPTRLARVMGGVAYVIPFLVLSVVLYTIDENTSSSANVQTRFVLLFLILAFCTITGVEVEGYLSRRAERMLKGLS